MHTIYLTVVLRQKVARVIEKKLVVLDDATIVDILGHAVRREDVVRPRIKVDTGFCVAVLGMHRLPTGLTVFAYEQTQDVYPLPKPSTTPPAMFVDMDKHDALLTRLQESGFPLDLNSAPLAEEYARKSLSDFLATYAIAHRQWLDLVQARLDRIAEEKLAAQRAADEQEVRRLQELARQQLEEKRRKHLAMLRNLEREAQREIAAVPLAKAKQKIQARVRRFNSFAQLAAEFEFAGRS